MRGGIPLLHCNKKQYLFILEQFQAVLMEKFPEKEYVECGQIDRDRKTNKINLTVPYHCFGDNL
jgi:hypothetical protein